MLGQPRRSARTPTCSRSRTSGTALHQEATSARARPTWTSHRQRPYGPARAPAAKAPPERRGRRPACRTRPTASSSPLFAAGRDRRRRLADRPVPRADRPVPGARPGRGEPEPAENGPRGAAVRPADGAARGPQDRDAGPHETGCASGRRARAARSTSRWSRCSRPGRAALPGARSRTSRRRAVRQLQPRPSAAAARPKNGKAASRQGRAASRRRSSIASPSAGTGRQPRVPPVDHPGPGGGQRGTAVGQRGNPLQQRGTAKHQRRARHRQGGTAKHQRGAEHRQRGAAGPQRRAEPASTATW